MKKPRIAITGPDQGGGAAWFFAALSVRMAGGIPVRIRPARPRSLDGLHGLIIGGGADVDPKAYTEEGFINDYLKQTIENKRRTFWNRISSFFRWIYYPLVFVIRKLFSRKKNLLDPGRDSLEFNLLDQAVKKDLPVLGICRGAQLINVYFQGTLYQDIHPFYQEEPNPVSIYPVKKVNLKLGSKLAGIVGEKELWVNALHNQAVKVPGNDIDIVAVEDNEVVQGIESLAYPFIVGVQWHPEYLLQKERHRRIFRELVKAARAV
jgi:putative glutamine amidotransferase